MVLGRTLSYHSSQFKEAAVCPPRGTLLEQGLHTINLTADHLLTDKVLDGELTPRWRQNISFKVVCI